MIEEFLVIEENLVIEDKKPVHNISNQIYNNVINHNSRPKNYKATMKIYLCVLTIVISFQHLFKNVYFV